jgi:4-carboxymuconolactone decarboxylase
MDYPDPSALPAELRDALTAHGSLNVYRMIMHSPNLAPSLLTFSEAILQANSLPPAWRELAILRVGHVLGADYQTHHHERIAGAAGLSNASIASAATGSVDGLPAGEAAVLATTDRMLTHHTLSESERDEVLAYLTANQLADLVFTVGFYQLVATFLNTFDVTTDGEPTP